MGKFLAIAALLLGLSGCSQHGESATGMEQRPLACPKSQASSAYSVSSAPGIDFVFCKLSPTGANALPVQLYIGNFPPREPGLQFFAFAPSPVGMLTWFSSRPNPDSRDDAWVAYMPTGYDFPAVIQIIVQGKHTPTVTQLTSISSTAASGSINPNYSFQRTFTRYAGSRR